MNYRRTVSLGRRVRLFAATVLFLDDAVQRRRHGRRRRQRRGALVGRSLWLVGAANACAGR